MFSDRKLSMSGGGSVGVDSTHAAFLAKVGGKISMTTKDGSLHSLTPSTPPTASRQHHLSAASSTAPAASYAFPGKQHFKSQKHAILQRRYKRKRNKVTFPGSTAATTNDDTKQLVVKSAPSLDQLGLEGMEESDGEDGMEGDGGNSELRLQTALPPLRAIAGAPYSDILALDEGMQLPLTASAGEMKCELPITVLKKEATTGPSSIPVLKAIHMPQMEPNIRQSQLLPHMMENSETKKASLTELEQLCLSKFTEKDLTATVVKEVAEEVRKRWIRVESVNPKEGQDELEGLPLSFQ
ncbi:hypothetical protein BC829DRAFT_220944 [Chytridium lagenaria]|nr:hypothetical protein BC829DRAFT_220944 [Chytridium lagenaria]